MLDKNFREFIYLFPGKNVVIYGLSIARVPPSPWRLALKRQAIGLMPERHFGESSGNLLGQDPYPASDFDEWAAIYDETIAAESGFPFEDYRRALQTVLDQAQVAPGMSVLDLGVGTGNLALLFDRAGCELWCSDFSPQMLARAQTPEELQAIATGYGSTPSAPLALLTLGAHAFADGDYERAQEIYRNFLQRYPKNLMSPVAEYGAAACLEAVGQIEAAFDAYARFATAHPDHYLAAGATLARGRCLEQQGRLDDARTIYEDFIAGHPDSGWLGQAKDALLFVNRDLCAQATSAAIPAVAPQASPATPAPAPDPAPTPAPTP